MQLVAVGYLSNKGIEKNCGRTNSITNALNNIKLMYKVGFLALVNTDRGEQESRWWI
jgi:hypothetical protein